jgi:hypothetical protein
MNVQELLNTLGNKNPDVLKKNNNEEPRIIDGDTVNVGGNSFRLAEINTPELPSDEVVDSRIEKAKKNKSGVYSSLANAGEVAKLNAELGTLDKETSITKGLGDSAISFNDSQEKPVRIDYGSKKKVINPYLPKDKYDRNILTNNEYSDKAVSEGFAIPFMETKSDRLQLALQAKIDKLGLWEDHKDVMQQTANKSGILQEPVNYDGRFESDVKNTAASIISSVAGVLDSGVDFARKTYGKENIDNSFEKAFFKNDFLNELKQAKTSKDLVGASQKYINKAESEIDDRLKENDYFGALKTAGSYTDVYLAESSGEMLLLAGKLPGLLLAVSNRVNNDIDKYKKEHNGKEPDNLRVGQMIATNTAVLGAEQLLVFKPFKKIIDKIKTGKNTVAGSVGGVSASFVGEGIQEVADTAQEKYNTEDKIIKLDEGIKSFIVGGAIGGTIRGSVESISALQSGARYASEKKREHDLNKNIESIFSNTSDANDLNFKVDIEKAGIDSTRTKIKSINDSNDMVQSSNNFEELANKIDSSDLDSSVSNNIVNTILSKRDESAEIYRQSVEEIYRSDNSKLEESKGKFTNYIEQNFDSNNERVESIKTKFGIETISDVKEVISNLDAKGISDVFKISSNSNTDINKEFIDNYIKENNITGSIVDLKNKADNILSSSTKDFNDFKSSYKTNSDSVNNLLNKAIDESNKKIDYASKQKEKRTDSPENLANTIYKKQNSNTVASGLRGLLKERKNKKGLTDYLNEFDSETLSGVKEVFKLNNGESNKIKSLALGIISSIESKRNESNIKSGFNKSDVVDIASKIKKDIDNNINPKKAKLALYDILKGNVLYKEDTDSISELIEYVKENGELTESQSVTAKKRLELISSNKIKPEPKDVINEESKDIVDDKDFISEKGKTDIKNANQSVRKQFGNNENIDDSDRAINKSIEDGFVETKELTKEETIEFLEKEGIRGYNIC